MYYCLTVREGKESEVTISHSIQYIPNINMHQEQPFGYNSATSVTMASGIQDCSLITPPDTPSPEANNHLSERFGEPRRYSSREHKQTTFFNPLDVDPSNADNNPRKRKIKLISGGAIMSTSRRMLTFEASEPQEDTESDNTNPLTEENLMEETTDSAVEAPDDMDNIDVVAVSPSVKSDHQDDDDLDNNEEDYPISTLVWGKLKGFDWWPGRISSHVEIGGMEPQDSGTLWVKWFGENQVSEMSIVSLAEFGCFSKYFIPTKLRGVYKKAVMQTLKEVARRCGKMFQSKQEDKSQRSYDVSLLQQAGAATMMKEEPIDDDTEADNKEEEEDDDVATSNVPSSATNDTTSPDANMDDIKIDASSKKPPKRKKRKTLRRNMREKNLVYLTQLEKEMIDWALNSFQPFGPSNFQPTETKTYPLVTATTGISYSVDHAPLSTSVTSGPGTTATIAKDKLNTTNNVPGSAGTAVTKTTTCLIPSKANKENFAAVAEKKLKINEICISCGSVAVVANHPLFEGGLCKKCKESFMECVYLFDDDGSQMYCTICCGGDEVFMCDAPNCSKVYCGMCIEHLCGKEELQRVQEAETWECYLCSRDYFKLGLLCKRDNWLDMLKQLFSNDYEVQYDPPEFIAPIPAEKRKPIRVLALFDGIATGMQVLRELGIEVDVYVSSEIDQDAVKVVCVKHKAVKHIGDIEMITEKQVLEWGPFDLVIGGSPCNDLSIVNPARKGIYEGTGRLFFEFFRILSYAKPHPDHKRPFFWMFENVVSMKAQDKQTISRFLQCNPVIVDAKDISAAHRARYFWGNLPGMNSTCRPPVPLPGDRLTLQDCLEDNCSRKAQFVKMRTITTKMNSVKQTKKAIMPVYMEGEGGDVLWCTEMERLFGFPDHYTDVANLGRCGRQRLLGKAWSIPVIRHLLSPLKDYFKSSSPLSSHVDHKN
ncbi:DNA (cytosine-5)-methyltransferase 3C-like isoform X3 [Dysidea avara]|uniref:DNA (cytosine-5)-methyltransferase 3C-like isoform X3 n=1 Tax=Dysidea avara TaxID=196820 RepID=UPI0033202F93